MESKYTHIDLLFVLKGFAGSIHNVVHYTVLERVQEFVTNVLHGDFSLL